MRAEEYLAQTALDPVIVVPVTMLLGKGQDGKAVLLDVIRALAATDVGDGHSARVVVRPTELHIHGGRIFASDSVGAKRLVVCRLLHFSGCGSRKQASLS